MKNILLTVICLISVSSQAQAFQLNHSWLGPNIGYDHDTGMQRTCPGGSTVIGTTDTSTQSCCTSLSPDGTTCADNTNLTVTTTHHQANVPRINEFCFHPTCYFRGINETLRTPMQVQPLTTNTQTIKNVANGLTDDKVGSTLSFDFNYTYPVVNYHYSVDVNYMSNWTIATGTSAMQGLLWFMAHASNNWHGVWSTRSDYESDDTDASHRDSSPNSVPNPSNSKNIIIISDGLDSDGPNYIPRHTDGSLYPNANPDGTVKTTTYNPDPGTPASIGFHRASVSDDTPIFETCDAHAPLASITLDNYKDVCKKMAAQNIQVNVILYLYANQDINNSPLVACAGITNGIVITDATPTNISTKLNNLVSQIVTKNIRLIK